MKFSNTNLNLYRSFVTLYETMNYPKAANLLGISRQAVGQNIKELANQLDIRLFSATNRGVKPTSEATSLYHRIKPALDQILRAEEDIVAFDSNSEGLIKIATTTNFAGTYLNEKILSFRDKYPNIKFDISILPVDSALAAMQSSQVHLVLSAIPLSSVKEYNYNHVEVETFEQSFVTTREFAKKHGITKIISREKFNELPLLAIRTIKHFVSLPHDPDIISDSQDTAISMIEKDKFISFGVWSGTQKVLGSRAFRFDVEGIPVKDLTIVCAYPRETELTQVSRVFIDYLVKGVAQR